jgi:hypothetical protein
MMRLLHEVWRRNDEIAISAGGCEATPITAESPNTPLLAIGSSVISGAGSQQSTPVKMQGAGIPGQHHNVHWRDIMRENGWDWLLIWSIYGGLARLDGVLVSADDDIPLQLRFSASPERKYLYQGTANS